MILLFLLQKRAAATHFKPSSWQEHADISKTWCNIAKFEEKRLFILEKNEDIIKKNTLRPMFCKPHNSLGWILQNNCNDHAYYE